MYVFVCTFVFVCVFTGRPEEGITLPEAAVLRIIEQVQSLCSVLPADNKSIISLGYCELFDLGSEDRTLVLCKNSKCF